MTDRREFLKLFGVGTAIVPIIGGKPNLFAAARFIEAPKVELASSSEAMMLEQNNTILTGDDLIVRTIDPLTQKVYFVHAKKFVISRTYLEHRTGFRNVASGLFVTDGKRLKVQIEGDILPDNHNEMFSKIVFNE